MPSPQFKSWNHTNLPEILSSFANSCTACSIKLKNLGYKAADNVLISGLSSRNLSNSKPKSLIFCDTTCLLVQWPIPIKNWDPICKINLSPVAAFVTASCFMIAKIFFTKGSEAPSEIRGSECSRSACNLNFSCEISVEVVILWKGSCVTSF